MAAARSALEGTDADGAEAGDRAAEPGGDEDRRGDVQGQQAEQAADAAAQAGPGGGAQRSGRQADDKVVDAEFEEVDDKKKKSA